MLEKVTLQITIASGGNSQIFLRLYSEATTTPELWTIEHETCNDVPFDSDRNSRFFSLPASSFKLRRAIIPTVLTVYSVYRYDTIERRPHQKIEKKLEYEI